MAASQPVLPQLDRKWFTAGIPGRIQPPGTYVAVEGVAVPPPPAGLSDDLAWLRALPDRGGSIHAGPDTAAREMTEGNLASLIEGWEITVPAALQAFVADEALHDQIRSTASAYLDLGDYVVPAKDGGRLIHVLSDQQGLLHWLVYVAPDGRHVVVISPVPLSFLGESGRPPESALDLDHEGIPVIVCAESIPEFLWRLRIENEIWFAKHDLRLEAPDWDAEEPAYVDAYPTTEASWD